MKNYNNESELFIGSYVGTIIQKSERVEQIAIKVKANDRKVIKPSITNRITTIITKLIK